MVISSRFATPKEALSTEFLTISKAVERFHHQYQMPDFSKVNKERMPWANGVLSPPEFYASRLWEYPWAILAAELSPGLDCVDVGSGTMPLPLYLKEIQKTHVIIVEPNIGGLPEHHPPGFGLSHSLIRKAILKVLPDSMENISLPDESVDRVFCISVLEHIDSPYVWQEGLREMARILRPGGRAIITVDLSGGKFFVHPFDIVRYSGLMPVGPIDLRMPTHRFGSMPTNLTDIDIFGMVLKKAESPITLPYLVKKRFYYSKLCLHKFSNSPTRGIIINKVYKAITRPDKATRWAVNRIHQAMQQALWRRSVRRSLREIPPNVPGEMGEFEAAIFENGSRCIPAVTHDTAEFVRHRNRYVLFRNIIARDRSTSFQSLFTSPLHVAILDLGCGVGHGCATLATLPNCSVLGIDMSPEAIQYASLHYKRPNVEYRVADILEFVDDMSEYDYIVSSHVLEHIENGFSILSKLRFRKKLLIATPYDEPLGNPHHAVLHIKEDVYAGFPHKKIYYDDFWGRIHRRKIASRPCGLICVISK